SSISDAPGDPAPFGAKPDLAAPWLRGQSPLEPVIGDKDISGDGLVIMLAMPGHAPGSYALLVRLARMGPVLPSGDIVHFEEQLPTDNVPPSTPTAPSPWPRWTASGTSSRR